jgi:uncharacterized lipoprotein YajG
MKQFRRTLTRSLFVLFFLFLAGCACTQTICNLTPGGNVNYQGGGKKMAYVCLY